MKVGLYFGSFNPIHIGHLIIANHFQSFTDLDQVWFIVSPQNPFKEKKSLANEYDRLNLVEIAIQEYPNLRASDIEFRLPKPSYTIDTLVHLEEKFPQHEFSLIVGSDNIKSISKWKNGEVIKQKYPIYVYPRPGFEIDEELYANITVVEAPLMEISSSFIRNAIKLNKNIKPMLPHLIWEQIDKTNLYK